MYNEPSYKYFQKPDAPLSDRGASGFNSWFNKIYCPKSKYSLRAFYINIKAASTFAETASHAFNYLVPPNCCSAIVTNLFVISPPTDPLAREVESGPS